MCMHLYYTFQSLRMRCGRQTAKYIIAYSTQVLAPQAPADVHPVLLLTLSSAVHETGKHCIGVYNYI